jgi:hypothetical protein
MSLDMAGFVMQVEREFGIEIPEEDYGPLGTVGALCEYIQKRSTISDPETVWKAVRRIASEEFQVPIDEIKWNSRWIEELRID